MQAVGVVHQVRAHSLNGILKHVPKGREPKPLAIFVLPEDFSSCANDRSKHEGNEQLHQAQQRTYGAQLRIKPFGTQASPTQPLLDRTVMEKGRKKRIIAATLCQTVDLPTFDVHVLDDDTSCP